MQNYSRFTINRSLIVLLPKQPVLDWLKQVDPDSSELTLAEIRREPDAFLVPHGEMELTDDAERWVSQRWKMFFERYLEDWYTAESYWPKNRTQKMFKEWFEIQFLPTVWDFSDEPVLHEDWDQIGLDD